MAHQHMSTYLQTHNTPHTPAPAMPKISIERVKDLNCAHSVRMLRENSHSPDDVVVPPFCSFSCGEKPKRPPSMPIIDRPQASTAAPRRHSLAGFFLLTDGDKPYYDRPASAPVYLFGYTRSDTHGRTASHVHNTVLQTTSSSTSSPTEDDIPAIVRSAIGVRARPCSPTCVWSTHFLHSSG